MHSAASVFYKRCARHYVRYLVPWRGLGGHFAWVLICTGATQITFTSPGSLIKNGKPYKEVSVFKTFTEQLSFVQQESSSLLTRLRYHITNPARSGHLFGACRGWRAFPPHWSSVHTCWSWSSVPTVWRPFSCLQDYFDCSCRLGPSGIPHRYKS